MILDGWVGNRSPPAEKTHNRKEVTPMTYTKPQITKLGDATELVCSDASLTKVKGGADLFDPHRMTLPAYTTEE